MKRLWFALLIFVVLMLLASPSLAQLHSKGIPYNMWQVRQYLSSAPFARTVTVDPGGSGDFTTYAAAVAFVATQNPTAQKPWKIQVYGGPISTGIELPEHVVVEGPDQVRAGGRFRLIGNTNASQFEVGETIEATSNGSISFQAGDLLQLTTQGSAVLGGQMSTEVGDQTGTGPTYLRSAVVLSDAHGLILPETCEAGQLFLDTGDLRLCACTASDTWACAPLQ